MSLTIIFSTRRLEPAFVEHLRSTVGVKGAQVLPYVNNNEFSLAEIYNRGLKTAAHDIVVFVHDDIIFDRRGWGVRLLRQFRDTEFGILGVAGTPQLVKDGDGVVERWWKVGGLGCVTHLVDGKYIPYWSYRFRWPVEVICLDGLFLAADRRRIREPFDERFPGFHFYDIPFTFRNHLAGVKVGVTYDVELTHKSTGVLDENWNRGRIGFTEIYGENIPYTIPLVTGRVRYFNWNNVKRYLNIQYSRHIGWRFKQFRK